MHHLECWVRGYWQDWASRVFTLVAVVGMMTPAVHAASSFVNFETAPVHPVALGPDGRTLAVCNLPDARVELFDVSSGVPIASGSVTVGLDPVTARFASADELWVVNLASSTINIIDVRTFTVVATLETPAGPSDLVFAGQPRRAWVSCARTNTVFVIDVSARQVVTNIVIEGERPRALAVSPDQTKVYVAIFESGNGTTVLGRRLTPLNISPTPGPVDDRRGPDRGIDPPPNVGNSFNPPITVTGAVPRVSHIVRKNAAGRWMDDNHADWTEWVSGTNAALGGRVQGWDLPDRDVAIINTDTWEVGYARRLMNLCMAIAVNPVSGQISVVGTDATNERRFEPVLKGVFLRVNLALVDPETGASQVLDLNPHLDYITRSLSAAERDRSLGDPRGIEWRSDGTRAYITGMGSRNLIIVDAQGRRLDPKPIELGEGPTGMAIDESRERLYVWNRFSSNISVVDTAAGLVITNVPVFDPTPSIVRQGRRHFYDTRRNSGLGIASCASCHPDGRMDRLAWDLGDPSGNRITNASVIFHPMKGPMVTQTLQDIITPTNFNGRPLAQANLHWRGDRRGLEEFNPTFTALLNRDTQLTTAEMAELKGMLASISFPPNYLRTFSNALPTRVPLPGHYGRVPIGGVTRPLLPPGDAVAGSHAFLINCQFCHDFNSGRSAITNRFIVTARNGSEGPFVISQLRSLADKVGMDGLSTNSRAGFGFMHDGRVSSLTEFLVDGFGFTNDEAIADMLAFLLCFTGSDLGAAGTPSQDVPASAGRQITLSSPTAPPLLNSMINLVSRGESRLELIIKGRQEGRTHGWLFQRSNQTFRSDRHGEPPVTLNDLLALAAPGNELTALLVPQGSGVRFALDRDEDGYFDDSELELGYNPVDPSSHPGRVLAITKIGDEVTLTWESAPGVRYLVQWAPGFRTPTGLYTRWSSVKDSVVATNQVSTFKEVLPAGETQRFYRLWALP
jgi:DNA-binding beta-propeller fold protein YncE